MAAVLGVLAGLLGAGISALPEPGIPPAEWSVAGDTAAGSVGVRYGASGIHRFWMGGGYRALWAMPVRVPLVDLDSVAGGLSPSRRGGGRQTRSLRLRGADGVEHVFRSLDKEPARALTPLHRALMGRVRQDQVSALHPGAAVIAAGLQDAAGLRSPPARLGVMPASPRLGEFQADFGLLAGTLQVYPRHGFAGARRVVDTEDLWAEMDRAPGDWVDARAYLAVRLMDVYLGDWDRHEGQLRWGRMETPDGAFWIPIPRDRDYALSDYRGVLPGLARRVDPKIVRFDTAYRDLRGLLVKARPLDARLLCQLPAATWDSAAVAMRRSLSDSVIRASIEQLPREWVARSAPLSATLRARRDRLPDAARRFRADLHTHCSPG